MTFDLNTLFFLTLYIEALLGLLLLLAWVQNLAARAVAWWGAAHLLRCASVALYGFYGTVPNWIAVDAASALLFLSYGLTWTGTRLFDGRQPRPGVLVAGSLAWVLVSHLPGISGSAELRHLLGAAIIGGFWWAGAYELWRGRERKLVSRWPAMVLLFAFGALFLLRPSFALLLPAVAAQTPLASAWLTVLSVESLMASIAIAFVFLAMSKEFSELGHKTAALRDPLTGLANRRSFMQDAAAAARQSAAGGRSVAVLAIDLDHFKAINDQFGHPMGDKALRLFGEICTGNLRRSDLVGRMGGEEFAVLLQGTTRENAVFIAERLRTAFEEAAATVDGKPLRATLSLGVAVMQGAGQDLDGLLAQADAALYRAKARGRNRVELAPLDAGTVDQDGIAPSPAADRAGLAA